MLSWFVLSAARRGAGRNTKYALHRFSWDCMMSRDDKDTNCSLPLTQRRKCPPLKKSSSGVTEAIPATIHMSHGRRRCRLLCITEVQRTLSSLTTTLSIYRESSVFQGAGECFMATASRDSGNLGVFCNITYDYRKLDLMTTLNLTTLCLGSLCFSFSVVLPNRKLSK